MPHPEVPRRAKMALLVAVGLVSCALAVWLMMAALVPDDPASLPQFVGADPPQLRNGEDGKGTIVVNREVDPGAESPRSPAATLPVRFRILDATTDRPIEAARLYAVQGAVLARTDADGRAVVEGAKINAMVFGADGYLVEHFFDRPQVVKALVRGLERNGYFRILLEPDELTVPARLRFVGARGSAIQKVSFRITALDEPLPTAGSVPIDMSGSAVVRPQLRAAWRRHAMLSTIPAPDFNPELLHFGVQSHSISFESGAIAQLRFVAGGAYRVDAQAGDLLGSQRIELHASLRNAIDVRLQVGAFVSGRVVVAGDLRPLAGAQVMLTRNGTILTSGESDAQGRFRLGPVAAMPAEMTIRHPEHAALEQSVTPVPLVVPAAAGVVYALQPLPTHRVRGIVRRRPDRQPVAGAEVRLVSGMGVAARGRTDPDGRFELASTLTEPTLEIRAAGFLEYVEMRNANGEQVVVELIPDQPEARMRAGLTAIITGRVLDVAGRPLRDCAVQVRPETPWVPSGIAGRRIVRGGIVPFQQMVVTGADGSFQLEWSRSESIRLLAVTGRDNDAGQPLTIKLGTRHQVTLR